MNELEFNALVLFISATFVATLYISTLVFLYYKNKKKGDKK